MAVSLILIHFRKFRFTIITGICLKPCPQGLSSFVMISKCIFSLMVKADVQNDFPIPQNMNISSDISCFDYRSFAVSKYLPLGARVVGPSCAVVLSLLFVSIFFCLAIHIGRKLIRHSEQTQRPLMREKELYWMDYNYSYAYFNY